MAANTSVHNANAPQISPFVHVAGKRKEQEQTYRSHSAYVKCILT